MSAEAAACPFCNGKGRTQRVLDSKFGEEVMSLVCDPCSGTGDRHLMELVRAFRLGQNHEHLVVMAKLTGSETPTFPPAEQIRRMVVDDATRQRYEDAGRAA